MVRTRIEVQNGNDELSFDSGLVTIGGRTGVNVVLRDVMVADRHCVITYEDGFVLRDTGSVTGTWVNGERAAPAANLEDGATIIIGTSKLHVSIGTDDGTQVLQLKSDPQSFWWKKPGKGAFDNDPDQLAYTETKFGRFPALRLGNRIAVIVGGAVLVAATILSSVMEPLADPGPLTPPHARVTTVALNDPSVHKGFIQKCVELSGAQGCNVCHETGNGTPESKCVQCHGLEGEMAAEGSLRHPYHKTVEGKDQVIDSQFCVRCHTDHNPSESLKQPIAKSLIGNCTECHDAGTGNLDRVKLVLPEAQLKGFEPLAFPHDKHIDEEIGCDVCHQPDPKVVADRERGVADNPSRRDFAMVKYAICATCHVAGASNALVDITAEQRTKWTPENLWTVDWHGVEDPANCAKCHAPSDDNDPTVFGPGMKEVMRGEYSTELYREERARFTVTARSHSEQFLKHSDGQACTKCHLDGKIAEQPASKPSRTFWHALHVTKGSLTPDDSLPLNNPASAAAISEEPKAGCISCHKTLGKPSANRLTPGPYTWPDDDDSRAACTKCHRDGQQAVPPVPKPIQSRAKLRAVADFPHDVHVGSDFYGKKGSLEQGCFACHKFSAQTADAPFRQVPLTLEGAADCTKCHGGHDEIAGGDCQKCHPADNGFNSFATQTGQIKPSFPKRLWPAPNGFSHLSAGHTGKDCAICHKDTGIAKAETLQAVSVPDETANVCRECHLQKQFHWR